MRHALALLMVCVALVRGAPRAQAASFESESGQAGAILEAHARTYTLFAFTRESSVAPADSSALVVERLRPVLEAWAWRDFELEAAWDVLPFIGAVQTSASGFAIQPVRALRLVDFDQTLYEPAGASWQLQHNLDRLSVAYLGGAVQVRLGRQAIGHGSARLLPAADLIAPFGPATIDTQFRRGVDALRLTFPVGAAHELELYAVAHEPDLDDGLEPGQWMYLLRWRSSFVELFDVSALAGASYGMPTLALDVSGDVFGAGWYAEGTVRLDAERERVVGRATAGLDYQWPFGLRTLLELHYNGPGAAAPYTGQGLTERAPEYRVGEVFLLGRWYAGAMLGYTPEALPLVHLSASYIQNLTDGSLLSTVGLGWDYSEKVTLGAGAIVPAGRGPELTTMGQPPAPALELPSEFGAYPVVGFTDVRLIF